GLASDCEWPSPSERFGKLTEALAEIEGRRQHAKVRCQASAGGAGAAPLHRQPYEHGKLVRSVLEKLILEGRVEIGEACERRTAGLAYVGPGISDRDPEILGNPL